MRWLLFSNEVTLEDNRVMKLDYELIEMTSVTDQETRYYGLGVTKYLDGIVETEEIDKISSSRDNVVALIKKLCQYEVTPVSTVEIVDELIAEGV